MENATYEQALTLVQALPPREQQRLWRWLDERQRPDSRVSNGVTVREREMQWLREHRHEYIGQWVALDGSRLISHDKDLGKVFDAARAQGVAVPFTAFVEDPDQATMGGW